MHEQPQSGRISGCFFFVLTPYLCIKGKYEDKDNKKDYQ